MGIKKDHLEDGLFILKFNPVINTFWPALILYPMLLCKDCSSSAT